MGKRDTANEEYCIEKRSREGYKELQNDILLCKSRQRSREGYKELQNDILLCKSRQRSTDKYCGKSIPIEANSKRRRGQSDIPLSN
jgi:hypothetical protein